MRSITLKKLLTKIVADFDRYQFCESNNFSWQSGSETLNYVATQDPAGPAFLLHELAHAELRHTDYHRDIELLRQESAAWEHAKTNLGPFYKVPISAVIIDDCLETYRNWLYQRSRCPVCTLIGIQIKKNTYSCINCRYSWSVNDARQCAVKRSRLSGRS